MNSRRITLIVAVVLALVTGVLTLRFLSSVNTKNQQTAVVMGPLIVASVDIPARTKIKAQMLTKVMRPAASIEPGSIADAKDVEGDIALATIPAQTPLSQSKVGVPAAIGVTGQLMPGQRAVSIPVDMVKSVSALVAPGDRVDVLASKDGSDAGGKQPRTKAIIRGVVVLAVNSTIQAAANASPPPAGSAPPDAGAPTTVTLAVTPAQADLLTVADLNSTLRLALRSPDEAAKSLPPEQMDFDTAAAPSAPSQAQSAPAAPASRPAPAGTPGVVVIEGDQIVNGAK